MSEEKSFISNGAGVISDIDGVNFSSSVTFGTFGVYNPDLITPPTPHTTNQLVDALGGNVLVDNVGNILTD
jgi:hypothetical protein